MANADDDCGEPPVTVRRVEVARVVSDTSPLSSGGRECGESMRRMLDDAKALRVIVLTWNMHGGLPTADVIAHLIPAESEGCHMIAVGTQECERSIGASLVFSSKASWESLLTAAIGHEYALVGSSTLGAIHIALYAWKPLLTRISSVYSGEVACGVANVVKNKGATALAVQIEGTSLLFLNCHLAAGQSQVERRNADWRRIDNELAKAFAEFRATSATTSTASLVAQFDCVCWIGDFNYRVSGNRAAIDHSLAAGLTEVLVANDQLALEKRRGNVLRGYMELPLAFAPTYKFDDNSDSYDSSERKRIPSWTDRVFVSITPAVSLLSYNSMPTIHFSDHRPVYATLQLSFQQSHPVLPKPLPSASPASSSSSSNSKVSSRVCSIQ